MLDELDELVRDRSEQDVKREYNQEKELLNQYDTFLDRHAMASVVIPLVLFLGGFAAAIIAAGVFNNALLGQILSILGIISLVSLPVFIVIAVKRSNRIKEIENNIESLKDEYARLKKHKNIASSSNPVSMSTADDYRLSLDDEKHKSSPWWLGFIVIIAVAGFIAYKNQHSTQTTQPTNNTSSQISLPDQDTSFDQFYDCVTAANNKYDSSAATATDLIAKTNYAILRQKEERSCHQKYPQSNSTEEISKLNASISEGERLVNEAMATGSSSSSGSSNNSYTGPTSCTSNSIGSSVYTRCY